MNASTYSHTSPNGGGVGDVVPGGFGLQGSFNEFEGNGGVDTITGNGNTRISYQSATGGVSVNLQAGTATGDASVGTDTFVNGVNAVRGSSFNDYVYRHARQSATTENFEGWGGNDFIDGNGGFDRAATTTRRSPARSGSWSISRPARSPAATRPRPRWSAPTR